MCGILVVYGENSAQIIKQWSKSLAHRGPDAIDYYHDGRLSIAFSRLSINDLSASGNQPHISEKTVSVINGEIYNHRELKAEYSINVDSESDTHIIGPLFEKIGDRIIEELDGFYSGVIYDIASRELFIIRDYIGKKGLFLVKTDDFTVITSELKAVPESSTFQMLPKGVSRIDISENLITLIKDHSCFLKEKTNQNLRELMSEAVKKRIPENMKFGVFLSGGLDSSILASLIHSCTDSAKYYILGTESESQDYQPACVVADYLGIRNVEIIPLPSGQELTELIKKVVYITESYNPSIISNGICTYLLSKAARRDGLKVVISGEGADEMFGGYHYFSEDQNWDLTRQRLLDDMTFTELRRVDLTCMSNSVEARFPYLDRKIYSFSQSLGYDDLYRNINGVLTNKYILREKFTNSLPTEIIWRKKTSSDVGTGLRKLVVENLTKNEYAEKEVLKNIWTSYYSYNAEHKYFHSYPVFDRVIAERGIGHKK